MRTSRVSIERFTCTAAIQEQGKAGKAPQCPASILAGFYVKARVWYVTFHIYHDVLSIRASNIAQSIYYTLITSCYIVINESWKQLHRKKRRLFARDIAEKLKLKSK